MWIENMKDSLAGNLPQHKRTYSYKMPWHRNSHILFLFFNCVYFAVFIGPWRMLVTGSWKSGYVTYIPFIPLITAYLLYTERSGIWSDKPNATPSALAVVAGFALLYGMVLSGSVSSIHDVRFSLSVAVMVLIWLGGFLFCYGMPIFRAAAFPLVFLFFVVPFPRALFDTMISFLQAGSAEVAYALIRTTGLPVVREGFVFHLSIMDIEIAPQCSGIRSALSLVIVGSLAAYLFLQKGWARAILIATLLPIAIVKNGLRIAVLTLMSVHVDPGFLEGNLHQKGGVPFFLLALLMASGVIALLRKMEGETLPAECGQADHDEGLSVQKNQ